jgi:hypothetical protein
MVEEGEQVVANLAVSLAQSLTHAGLRERAP